MQTMLQPAVQAAATDALDQLRDFVAEQLAFTATQIACARMFLDISDDAGAIYSVNTAKAHFRAAAQATADLSSQKAKANAVTR